MRTQLIWHYCVYLMLFKSKMYSFIKSQFFSIDLIVSTMYVPMSQKIIFSILILVTVK